MKVILQKNVPGLGERGQIKEVKDGYAHNYLLPRGLAAEATPGNVRSMAGQKKAVEDRSKRDREDTQQLASQISQVVLEIRTRAGEGGRLFGAVTAQNLADALEGQGVRVSKRQVELDEPIKTAGSYKVPIRISPGVVVRVEVNVVGTA